MSTKNSQTFWPLKIRPLQCLEAPGSDYPWMKHHLDKEWNPHVGRMKNLRFYYNVMINELITCLLKISKYVLLCKKEAKLAICIQCTKDSELEMWESYRLTKKMIKFLLIHNCLMQWLWYRRLWLWTEYDYVIKTNHRAESFCRS